MNDQEFSKLKTIAFETGEIPNKYFCEECGCVKVTLDQSYQLKKIFYDLSTSPPSRPILVDICECDKEADAQQIDNSKTNTKVIAQFEAIRRSGLTNMIDKNTVQHIANKNNFYELVIAIEDDYSTILLNYSKHMKLITEEDIPELEES